MASPPIIRILCVDDHPLVRKGIASIVANEPDMRIVAEAGTGEDALVQFRAHQPDVTLMDLRLPDQEGAATTEARGISSRSERITKSSGRASESPRRMALRWNFSRFQCRLDVEFWRAWLVNGWLGQKLRFFSVCRHR